ncbi:acetate--CoA ligase family protein [Streptomyces iconiensis]|uniref:Acetate--CoA ligase family protein n=1 Tax=Streptomyces iconiensis TaxID=1384038 RepID=A0ABT7A0W5_9ACTN|nr:acetate--CoA ligase family protein [Streptomyces iconiensis]MDJ1134961.1 acetate--CoA ligase family protein [Streptomyces iconiensis]
MQHSRPTQHPGAVQDTAVQGRMRRLFAPRHIAVFGGEAAAEAVRQCRALGYGGEIWPVHPYRDSLEGLPCHRDVASLPAAPDAAFVAVPRAATVEVVGALAARGAGGAVCHASGFAEEGAEGARLQDDLRTAAGGMPVIGPNCIGVLNYLDGTALWADQHGGRRVESGVAVITQSGNIGQNLTMQRRSLPLAHVVTAGNSAVTGIPELIEALAEDPRVTAIGLHLEGIADAGAFSRAARAARRHGVPLVALKTGTSELGARSNLSHTSSLAGSDVLCDALFRRLGVARVHEIGTFLETLKLLHVHGPLPGTRLVSASCSGGEAALVADAAHAYGAELPELSGPAAEGVRSVLGPRVHVANPLDYQTAIWGDVDAQRHCFEALLTTPADVGLLLLDLPRPDRCADGAWSTTLDAFVAALGARDADAASGAAPAGTGDAAGTRSAAGVGGARACVVSSLPEGIPEDVGERLVRAGIAPLQGVADCVRAIAAARGVASAAPAAPVPSVTAIHSVPHPVSHSVPHPVVPDAVTHSALDEHAAKRELLAAGVRVPAGGVAAGAVEAEALAAELGYPVVAKALDPALAHKTEAGAVRLGLADGDDVREAVTQMRDLAETFLIERMESDAVAELLVGVRRDEQFGPALTLGTGGVLVELVRDTTTLLLPAPRAEIEEALRSLRIWPVLAGYRGRVAGDVPATVDAILAAARHAYETDVTELDINPLLVLPEGRGAVAVDALIRRNV